MPSTERIGGPATRFPGMFSIASKNACLRVSSSSVPGDGGKTVRPLASRNSLAGNPGMKMTGFRVMSASQLLGVTRSSLSLPFAVLDLHLRLDPAADVEVALDLEEARGERGDEVVGDAVRDRLVERPLVAERPEVELE